MLYMVVYSDPITLSLILPDLSDIALSGNKIFVLLLNYQLKILLIILLIIIKIISDKLLVKIFRLRILN